jgi:GTPase SAR1 family protein
LQEFASARGMLFMECSAQGGENIEDLFSTLSKSILEARNKEGLKTHSFFFLSFFLLSRRNLVFNIVI